MIDHVLGRPSAKSRRLQVLAVISFWSFYLYKGNHHGPPGFQHVSKLLSARLTAWQMVLTTLVYLYASRNFSALVGLASPEPMANMYDKTFFRATWALTALDAGFWTAMRIKTKWVRDLASIFFSLFYLVAAERADEKVRKERAIMTVEHIRVSWNKGTTPYLAFLQRLMRPRLTKWPPRQIRIPRPPNSDYKDAVVAWLYFDGPVADLAHHSKVVMDIPGGGFVAMDPRCNDDKLFAWAAKSGLPILSLDYGKAPEHPYPYALNECFDAYATIVRTRGRCIGMSGAQTPRVVISGDSAGGNLAISTALMILETSSASSDRFSGRESLPAPEGILCFYPALDMNIGNWMSDEQMSLIRDRKLRKTNRPIARRKSMQYSDVVGTPHHSDGEDDSPSERNRRARTRVRKGLAMTQPEEREAPSPSPKPAHEGKATSGSLSHHPQPLSTRLATSSMISYFNDRVLTPEMMRAMILLYIGANNRPDFSKDYLLSPVLAPDTLLRRFPKIYLMTGERDPLVDDTVIFAGRLRRAKDAAARERLGISDASDSVAVDEADAPEVVLLPGISHGFLQFSSVYPPARRIFDRSAAWFGQLFTQADEQARTRRPGGGQPTRHPGLGESSGEEDKPLEMSMTKPSRGRSVTQPAPTTAPHGENGDGVEANPADAGSPSAAADGGSRGAARKVGKKAAGGGQGRSKSKKMSIVKLNSSDDLLGRRMQGLANGLTGLGGED